MQALDVLQAASNAVAGNVTGPVDILSLLLRKIGVPVPENALGSSQWAREHGLLRDVDDPYARAAGESLGIIAPMVAAAKAPQIARGLLQAGDNLAAPRMLDPQTGAIVWHGSPHKFDRFDSSKIGTGEGAQAYGHGLYLAESPKVARGYQEKLSDAVYKVDGAAMPGNSDAVIVASEIQSRGANGAKSYLLAEAEKASRAAAESGSKKLAASADNFLKWASLVDDVAARQFSIEQGGHIYKVDLPDDAIARMLDWDKPLSQQAPGVQKAVQGVWDANFIKMVKSGKVPALADANGSDVYTALGKSPEMAAQLRQAGIPGIRYLDGGSRAAGTGTRNYVVFPGEEALLTILERNGIPLP